METLTREEIAELLEYIKTSDFEKNVDIAFSKAINYTYDFTKLNSKELEYVIEYLTQLKNLKKISIMKY